MNNLQGLDGKSLTLEQVIKEYDDLVRKTAYRMGARLPANIEVDDLISVGFIGLIDAYNKYDPTRDNKFRTYAEFRVRGEMLDHLREQDWMKRVTREAHRTLEDAENTLRLENREVTMKSVQDQLGMNDERFKGLIEASSFCMDYIQDNTIALSTLKEQKPDLSQVIGQHFLAEYLKACIEKLGLTKRVVLLCSFYEDMNQREIAQMLGYTDSRISQIHKQGLADLKARILKEGLVDWNDILVFSTSP